MSTVFHSRSSTGDPLAAPSVGPSERTYACPTGPIQGDPRTCRTTCSYWNDLIGDCVHAPHERTCGQRTSRLRERMESERPFHLFGDQPVAADKAAQMARIWRQITFER